MWKDFFYYSKSERRAIIVLLVLAVAGVGGILGLNQLAGNHLPVRQEASAEIDSFLAGISVREKRWKEKKTLPSKSEGERQPLVLAPFDPNVADSIQLRRLGLDAFVVRNILRYRAKGGVFRTPEALSRIYGLSDSQFVALRPYICIIPQKTFSSDTSCVSSREEMTARQEEMAEVSPGKFSEGTVVPLNQADTSLLKRIPGIGSGLARMIVAYRHRLGGFSRVEQLQEIPHVEVALNKWFDLKDGPYRKIRVNHDGLDRLRNHPYMNFYKAKAIVEYRRKRGRLKNLSQIAVFEEFSDDDIRRLAPYFSFD